MPDFFLIKISRDNKSMRTKESSEFYSSLQRYVFITPDVDINPDTNLPYDENDYCVVDVDFFETHDGCMPINQQGAQMELWAILEPGELKEFDFWEKEFERMQNI